MIGCEPPIDHVTSLREKKMKKKDKKWRENQINLVESLLANLTVEHQSIKLHTDVDEYQMQVQEFFEEEKSL